MTTFLQAVVRWMRTKTRNERRAIVRVIRRPLVCEPLEPRVLLSSSLLLDSLADLATAAPPLDDRFEQNDSFGAATNLGTIPSVQYFSGLTLNDDDWFKFTTNWRGQSADHVRIDAFLHSRGDIDLELYDAGMTLLAESDSTNNFEQVSLNGRPQGTYFVRVLGFAGATNPSYRLKVDAPYLADDRFENNDTRATARNLGTLTTPVQYANLVQGDEDWFKFTTTRTGTEASFVQIGFKHGDGDIDLKLYNANGTLLETSNSAANYESLSLDGRPAGTYYAQVYGFSGARNPSYDLSIAAPNSRDGEHTLFVNFDGASLSRDNLNLWSGNGGNGLNPGQWFTGLSDPTNGLDDDNNGINVTAFLASSADRETVIAGILRNLNTDLAAFGIQAVRHFGIAVAGVEATTLFLGPSTLTNGNFHVACSIDVGNDDLTDIAFIGDENWSGVTSSRITALSDVALHEAGHTFGLYHVNSGTNTESMGLRYSQSESRWLQNTSFQNRTYQLREFTAGNFQNSYQYMRDTFVLGVAAPSPAGVFTSDMIGNGWSNAANSGLLSLANVQSTFAGLQPDQPWTTASPLTLTAFAAADLVSAPHRLTTAN